MIEYKHEDLFRDGTDKQLNIVSTDGRVNITNSEIHYEQFELKESLCSQSELIFGSCEASQIKFKISNVFTSMVGMQLAITTTLEGHTDAPFSFGKYWVVSDKPTADRRYRNVTAYDFMYYILNKDVATWYKGLTFPMTLRQFRDRFCAYFGVEQEEITLINDNMTVEKTIDPGELPGKSVIEAICELNGCFGHITRAGKLRYVILKQMVEGVYPADDLYPSDDLYPADPIGTTELSRNTYISCEYEDFIVRHIDKLQIRQEENDIGAISGIGDNGYVIEDNFLVYGKSAADLQTIADRVLSVIAGVWYRPAQIEARGNPCLEVGDGLLLYTSQETIYTYILSRTLKGIQALRDSYTAEGEEYRTGQVNGIMKSIIQLKGKSNVLTRTVEETRLQMKDIEQGLSNDIKITASGLQAEITRASGAEENLSNRISVTANGLDAEIKRASESEGNLSNRISVTASGLDAEIKRASEAEGTLSNSIKITASGLQAEIKRASDQEGELSTKISAAASGLEVEVNRAKGAEQNLSAQIKVHADAIDLKVSKGDVSSQLSIESGQVSISGDRFILSATNCSITKEGKITAKDVDLSGKITASSGSIAGFTIASQKMYSNIGSLGSGISGVYIGTDGISLGNKVILKSDGSATLKDAELSGDLKITGGLASINFSSGGNSMSLDKNGISFAASSISTKITSSEISIGSLSLNSKMTSEGIQIHGSAGYLDIYSNATTWASSGGTYYLKDNSNNNLAYISTGKFSITASNILIGSASGKIAFFGSTTAIAKKSVSKVTNTTSVSAVATTLNSLLDALKAYNLIG